MEEASFRNSLPSHIVGCKLRHDIVLASSSIYISATSVLNSAPLLASFMLLVSV